MPDYQLQSTWEEIDAAAQAIKNGVQKSNLAPSVKTSLEKADGSIQKSSQLPASDWDTTVAGVDDEGKIVVRPSMSDEAKYALLDIVAHIIWDDDDGQSRYNNLQAALYEVESISATFTPGSYTIFDTNTLDDLRQFLVVTAVVGGESVVITDYTLSGEMDAGTNTITVEYGGKTTTFSVTVVSTALPEGYTAYDYVESKTTNETAMSPNNFIWTNDVPNMQELSLDVMLMKKDSTVSTKGILGARNATGDADNSVSIYLNANGLTASQRDKWAGAMTPVPETRPFRLEIINPETSPYYWRIDGGELHEVEWETSTPVPYGFSLFNNIPHGSTSNMSLNGHTRIGRIILRNYSGQCVGYYKVCTYSGKIGLYDLISETFQTAVTATAVTINNSNCKWAVGNWT